MQNRVRALLRSKRTDRHFDGFISASKAARSYFEERPQACLIAAAVAGMVVGWIVKRRRW